MDEFNERIKKSHRDFYFKHCRKRYWEMAVPVYRNGSCVLVVFAGLYNPNTDREKMQRTKQLLPFFVSGICELAEKTQEKDILGNSLRKKIKSYVKENFNQPISTRDLAIHLSLSVTRVCHLVKTSFGKTFSEMLTEERIRHAELFLKQSDFRIKEISGLCGFQSPEHFNRVFRSATGKTPGTFRNSDNPVSR
jgi:AraC family transcriptional regulator